MNVITNTPTMLFNESRKRGLLLLCVFVFPIFFTTILFLIVVISTDIDFKVITHESKYARIETPKNRSTVNKNFEISGSLETPLADHSFYLLEYRNKRYWPKFDLGNKATNWNKKLIHRANTNQFASYKVIMADAGLKATLDTWFKTTSDTGKYPGISALKLSHVVANVRVKTQ